MGSGASSTAAAAPKDSKKPVQLLPTHNVQVPSKCARLYFGLSWSAKANIDIDASAVCLAGAQVADIISFQKLRDATPASIVHTGDVLTSGTGTGTSDLERIYVQPEAMEKRGVDNIFLVVNVYTQGRTFCDVSSAYARLVHADSDQELARFNLKGCRGDALVFAKLYKHGNKWNWMGLGQQGSGRTAAEVAKALALRMVPAGSAACASGGAAADDRPGPRAARHARPENPGAGAGRPRAVRARASYVYTWLSHPRQHGAAAAARSPGQEGARRWC